MNRLFLFFVLSFVSISFSQSNFNQLSIEAGYGYNSPITGFSKENGTSFSGFRNFDIGLRFMFDEEFGIKAGFISSKFETNSNDVFGTNFNTISMQGYYNLAKVLDFSNLFDDSLGLLFHAGLGYSILTSKVNIGNDQVYSFIAGLTPQYKLSNRLAFYIDFAYYYNTSHDFNYDGTIGLVDGKKFNTQMYTVSAGLILSIGGSKTHADWY